MSTYKQRALKELEEWKIVVSKKPSLTNLATKKIQNKINGIIPDKIHVAITEAIKNMIKGVLLGSDFISKFNVEDYSFEESERKIIERKKYYKALAITEGAWTGSGGFLLGFVDFPLLLSIKLKYLYDAATLYGYNILDYKERLYILHIFQISFSSQKKTKEIYERFLDWDKYILTLPDNIEDFDWRTFQQEYRDYMDIAKMIQLLPVVGAVAGAYANNKLMEKLHYTTLQAYRLRIFENEEVKNNLKVLGIIKK